MTILSGQSTHDRETPSRSAAVGSDRLGQDAAGAIARRPWAARLEVRPLRFWREPSPGSSPETGRMKRSRVKTSISFAACWPRAHCWRTNSSRWPSGFSARFWLAVAWTKRRSWCSMGCRVTWGRPGRSTPSSMCASSSAWSVPAIPWRAGWPTTWAATAAAARTTTSIKCERNWPSFSNGPHRLWTIIAGRECESKPSKSRPTQRQGKCWIICSK